MLPPPEIASSGWSSFFFCIASPNSFFLVSEVNGSSISAGPRLFCLNCRTISWSMVLLPCPTSCSVSSETVEKKTGLPKPSTPKTKDIGRRTTLPSFVFFKDSKITNYDYIQHFYSRSCNRILFTIIKKNLISNYGT